MRLARAIEYLELGLVNLQATASPAFLHLSIQRYHLAGLETITEIGAVEPDALESCSALPRHHFKDWKPLGTEHACVANLGDDGGHFSGLQFGYPAGVDTVFVTERQVVEQILYRRKVFLRQPFGYARTHAFHELDFRIEVEHFLDDNSGDVPVMSPAYARIVG